MRDANAIDSMGTVDRWGAMASSVCVLHCLLFALAPATLVSHGLAVHLGERLEWAFVVVAATLALGAALRGARRHGSWAGSSLLVVGVAGLLLGRLAEQWSVGPWSVGLSVVAGVGLVTGHALNARACRRRKHA